MGVSERAVLWARLRRKQVQSVQFTFSMEAALWGKVAPQAGPAESVQFYRQKPIGNYIVDFYAPRAKIVVEVDGSQHMESEQAALDQQRDAFLASQGLRVLRFDSRQVLKEIEGVMEVILDSLVKTRFEEVPAL